MRRFRVISLSVIFAILAIAVSCSQQFSNTYFKPHTDADMFKVSVKILNAAHTSGGSGVIYRSSSSGSLILTNRHVCRLAEQGGAQVEAPDHTYHKVVAYKESIEHDLCEIRVSENLHMNIKLGNTPELGDEAIIVGHPNLFPTTVTRSHFSEKSIIEIQDGERDCTDREKADPIMGFFCSLFGKIPNVIEREAIFIPATIMAGSSGSPVFDHNGELAAMVFAGQGGLSYAFCVPSEAIWTFVGQAASMPWVSAL